MVRIDRERSLCFTRERLEGSSKQIASVRITVGHRDGGLEHKAGPRKVAYVTATNRKGETKQGAASGQNKTEKTGIKGRKQSGTNNTGENYQKHDSDNHDDSNATQVDSHTEPRKEQKKSRGT